MKVFLGNKCSICDNLTMSFGFRLPKTRSVDDLLSACDPGSLLTRTSSDPNLNNHCQDARVGLELRHPNVEEAVAGNENAREEPSQVSEQQELHPPQTVETCNQPHTLHVNGETQKLNSIFSEVGTGNEATPAVTEGICLAQSTLGQKKPLGRVFRTEEELEQSSCDNVKGLGLESNGTWDLIEPSLQPSAYTPIWNRPVPSVPKQDVPGCQNEEDGKSSYVRHGEASSQMGKAPPEWWRKGISQSQTSEFSLLGANWDSFQGMGISLPGGDVGPRHLFSYGCCNKRLSSRPFWTSRLCLSGQWPMKESAKPQTCSGHSGTHCTGLAVKSSRLWLPCHLKHALGTKPVPPNSPSPVPPLYLDDDGLPFPTDVIQHRLRQIEATYKQEVEQLRRQVRELQLRLDIRHCYAPPAEPQMDYEDDFVSEGYDCKGNCT